jgi:hypothetical protein
MILDNLSIAGLFVASLYLLLPLLFGKELWRVDEGATPAVADPTPAEADADGTWGYARGAAPCSEG